MHSNDSASEINPLLSLLRLSGAPKGPQQISPGQRPGKRDRQQTPPCKGTTTRIGDACLALSGRSSLEDNANPGRCPGLICCRTFGALKRGLLRNLAKSLACASGYDLVRRAIWIAIAWLVFSLPVMAQEQEVRTIPFDGPEIVCHILHSLDLKPILTLEDAATDPKDTVIIVLGNPQVLGELRKATGGIKRFLKNGGSLLFATDFRLVDHDLLIQISGKPVRMRKQVEKEFAYRGELQCPLLSPIDDVSDHPIFSFLHKGIATNCPSNVDVFFDNSALQDLLIFPFGPFRLAGGGLRGGPERYLVGSSRDTPPSGRALYFAGHGMFMNGMMLQTDNDNFNFTVNVVRWLREAPRDAKRTQALFIVNGEIITDFDMKLTPPPPPIPIPPAKMLSRLIRGLENERFFHRLLADVMGSNIGRVVAIIAGLVTFALLLTGARVFMARRHHLETTVPSLGGPQAPMTATAPLEQRQQALMRQGNYWDEARYVTLEWFRHELDVLPNRWLAGVNARFHAEGFFWTRRRLQREADYVLRLARSTDRLRVSRHEFFVLLETLREMSVALKAGRLALHVEGKNVRQPLVASG
jgi:hypothetical protein